MKLDSRFVSDYPEKSRGYRFYCPNHSSRIIETGNSKFIENGEVSGSTNKKIMDINEIRVNVSLPINISTSTICSNPQAWPDSIGGSEPKPKDAGLKPLIKFISST